MLKVDLPSTTYYNIKSCQLFLQEVRKYAEQTNNSVIKSASIIRIKDPTK